MNNNVCKAADHPEKSYLLILEIDICHEHQQTKGQEIRVELGLLSQNWYDRYQTKATCHGNRHCVLAKLLLNLFSNSSAFDFQLDGFFEK